MSADAIWRAFAETGDPVYYLLYKSAEDQSSRGKKQSDDRREADPSGA